MLMIMEITAAEAETRQQKPAGSEYPETKTAADVNRLECIYLPFRKINCNNNYAAIVKCQ